MATEARKFKIGLFVMLGLIIAVGSVIALGASQYFTDTRTYLTYFEESVNGLETDSLVRYRGVPIGRVHAIRIAPDGRLVETELRIDANVKIDPDMRVRIQMAGITGMKYLEIDRGNLQSPAPLTVPDFHVRHPVIPSSPSDIEEILQGIDQVFRKISALDIDGISARLKESLDAFHSILAREEWAAAIQNIEGTTAYWRDFSGQIDEMLKQPGVKDTLAHAAETLKSLRDIASELDRELEDADVGLRLKESTEKFDRFVGEATHAAEEVRFVLTQQDDNISQILENLRMAAESLNNLASSLRDNPAQLLFAQPPEPER